ncbi:hypothetical protein ACFW6V_10645 [Streptomyces sp. NPDC058734]|uniref:hypothetical protein n=1 Tax=Streptomyces sp. NPDC058734 TaxID=3346615 RepID=UPI0036779555
MTFFGRREELRQLRSWCTGQGPAVRLLTGPGGQGKTRLALELVRSMCAETPVEGGRWACGFLESTADPQAVKSLLEQAVRPTLLVLDYSETRRRPSADQLSQVEELARAAASARHDTPVRLLLIARSVGDWWDQVQTNAGELLSDAEVLPLSPLAPGTHDRQKLFTTAWECLARQLRMLMPGWQCPVRVPQTDLTHARYASALMLQLEALAHLLEPDRAPGGRRAEDVVLAHEEAYWRRAARAAGVGVHPRIQRRAVAVASLFGARDERAALGLISDLAGMGRSTEDDWLRIALWLRDLYPPSHSESGPFWGSLQPDLLAETLVADVLGEDPRLLTDALAERTAEQARQALTILVRGSLHHAAAEGLLLEAVPALGPNLAEAARVVSEAEAPEPLVAALTGLDRRGLPVEVLWELLEAIPLQSHHLGHFAVEVQGDITEARQSLLAEGGGTDALRALVRSLKMESIRCESVGSNGQALRLLERAVSLAESHTSEAVLTAVELAELYGNLSTTLALNGNLDQAVKAAAKSHGLLAALDDEELPLDQLAASVGKIALRAIDLGRYELAVEQLMWVVDAFEQIIKAERAAGGDPGHLEAARSRAARWRTNLAGALSKADRHQEAIEHIRHAVEERRELTRVRPDAHRAALALSLHNLAAHQHNVGDDTAVHSAAEAVAIYAALACKTPSVYLPRYVSAMNAVVNLTPRSGDPKAFPDHLIGQAKQLYADLRRTHPEGFLPVLTISMHLSSKGGPAVHWPLDPGTGDPLDIQQAEEAVGIYRGLLTVDRTLYREHLISALQFLGQYLSDANRHSDAVPRVREAIVLLGEGPDINSSEWTARMAGALFTLFAQSEESGHPAYELGEVLRYAHLCRSLGDQTDPDIRAMHAGKLCTLAIALVDADREPDAVTLLETAVGMHEALDRLSPGAYARTLGNVRLMLAEARRLASGLPGPAPS